MIDAEFEFNLDSVIAILFEADSYFQRDAVFARGMQLVKEGRHQIVDAFNAAYDEIITSKLK